MEISANMINAILAIDSMRFLAVSIVRRCALMAGKLAHCAAMSFKFIVGAVKQVPLLVRKASIALTGGFFDSAISTLSTMVVAIGAGLGVWGVINLLEGYGSDNPGAKSQGIKQLMAGAGIMLIGTTLIPQLSSLL